MKLHTYRTIIKSDLEDLEKLDIWYNAFEELGDDPAMPELVSMSENSDISEDEEGWRDLPNYISTSTDLSPGHLHSWS